jgi:hypothetical protein
VPIGKQRLEHLVFVGVDAALDHVFAKSPGRIDQHDLVESRLRIDRKHHAGSANVGANHLLHANRESDLQVIEPFRLPVDDRPIREERRKATTACVEQRRFSRDIEKGLLLTGEASVGQVLGSGTGADRHVGIELSDP